MQPDSSMATLKTAGAIVAAALALALASRIEIPLPISPISYSAQSLVVVIVGALLGPLVGGIAVGLYVAAGLVGLPVFQHGGSGMEQLGGPTGGFLLGFIPAAVFMGYWTARGLTTRLSGLFTGAFLTHVIILACGWVRLTFLYGATSAWALGVRPFLDGALFKTLVACGVLFVCSRYVALPWLGRRVQPSR